ncbi:MAG TPA: CBS domain-containing protein [Candidatus Binatia bacterium]
MSTQEKTEASELAARRAGVLNKYRQAAAVRSEYLLRRQKKDILEKARRVAIVGAVTETHCASYVRTEKLLGYGLDVLPVMPGGGKYLGLNCYASLREVPGEIDIVQVYPREGVELVKVAKETVEKRARAFWIEEAEGSQEVLEVLSQGKVQLVEHESLEQEYSKHFPFYGPKHENLPMGRRVAVGERMTSHPVVVHRGEGINEALDKMKAGRFRHLPVVDEEGRLIGMLSDRDVRMIRPSLAFVSKEEAATQVWSTAVEQAAVFDPIAIHPEALLEDAAALMLQWEVGGLPVVGKDRRLLGIITYCDLLREFVARGR